MSGAEVRRAAGAGAAGGLEFAAMLLLGTRKRPGIELLLELVSFDARLHGTGPLITREGSMDEQTLRAESRIGVVRTVAHDSTIPVIAVAGRWALTADQSRAAGIADAYALAGI